MLTSQFFSQSGAVLHLLDISANEGPFYIQINSPRHFYLFKRLMFFCHCLCVPLVADIRKVSI